jgi:farnesyl-diphosphate farnesyltransferase
MGTRISLFTGDDYEMQILNKVSRSFALTIPQLPKKLRRTVTNAYLLCRIVDTIEDEPGLSLDQKRVFFHGFVDVVHQKLPAKQFADGLYPLLSERTLPAERELIHHTSAVIRTFSSFSNKQQAAIRRCVDKMSSGMLGFQEPRNSRGLETIAHMSRYCYYVAGVVGEMLTDLFCDYSETIAENRKKLFPLGASFGQGLQMTNILKDLWDDKARGACWLPRDVFRKVGFDLNCLAAGDYRAKFGEGLAVLIGITRGHLTNGLAYTLLIPKSETGIRRFCLWAIGMAIFTLRNIDKTRNFTNGRDVKISRRTARAIMMMSNAALKSNFSLKVLFKMATHGLTPTSSLT